MAKKSNRWVFYTISLFSMLFSAIYLSINRHNSGFDQFLFDGGSNLIGDFINNLHYPTHEGGPYFDSMWASFPPLAYTFYYLFHVCFTRSVYVFELLAYTVITSITCVLMFYSTEKLLSSHLSSKSHNGEALWLCLCLLLSGSVIYTIERGNSVFNVMVMLLWAFAFRDSPEAWKRELSLLLIAVAANFKLYPAVFGMIYVFEKRWKESARLLLYGILLFIIPFAWFGGLEGFKQFLINQSMIHTLLFDRYLTSIPSVSVFLAAEFGWNSQAALQTGQLVSVFLAIILIISFVLDKRFWNRCLLLCSFFTLIPGWCAEYMSVYMAVPFLLCYCDATKDRWFTLYMALFAGIFILLPFGVSFQTHTDLSWNTLISFGSIYCITLLSCIDSITARFSKHTSTH